MQRQITITESEGCGMCRCTFTDDYGCYCIFTGNDIDTVKVNEYDNDCPMQTTQQVEDEIKIFFSADDKGYIAIKGENKNISGFGVTPQDALKELLIAIALGE